MSTAPQARLALSTPLNPRPPPRRPSPPPQQAMDVTKVQLQAGEEIRGAFIFVGDKSSNNGMDNPVCAMVR